MAFPYVQSPDRLVEFLKRLPTVGIPKKANNEFLQSLGYTSSNDRGFLSVLKFIGMADGSGTPTDLWRQARSNFPASIAGGIQAGYGGLYQTYPNAHQQSVEAIKNYFKAQSSVGDAAVTKMVSTFRAMTSIGEFSSGGDEKSTSLGQDVANENENFRGIISTRRSSESGVILNLNIELQVPPDPTGEVYEKFFASMKKHLMEI